MKIIVKNILIEAYHFIRLDKRYYGPFFQIYSIIIAEFLGIKPEFAL